MPVPTIPIKSTIDFELQAPLLDGQALDLDEATLTVSLLLKNSAGVETEHPATVDMNAGFAKASVDITVFGTTQDEWFRRWRVRRTSDGLDIRSQNWIRFWVV